jgi:hypothetical protein
MIFGAIDFAVEPFPPVSMSEVFGTTGYGYTLEVTQAPEATGTASVHGNKMYVQKGGTYTF